MENTTKPTDKVVGENGNVYVTLGICQRAMRKAGLNEASKEMVDRVFKAQDYDEALCIMMEYCELE